jgi:hypothetical protein
MHPESYAAVDAFAKQYVTKPCHVGDVGSYDVNGTFRTIFPHCTYVGLDIAEGPGVDRVVKPYDFGDELFDVLVSGSALEHVQDMKFWAWACISIMRPGGLICVVAPHGTSGFTEHRHPVDCWRIWPDGMRWLFQDLEILDCRTDPRDTVMIARRPVSDTREPGKVRGKT